MPTQGDNHINNMMDELRVSGSSVHLIDISFETDVFNITYECTKTAKCV